MKWPVVRAVHRPPLFIPLVPILLPTFIAKVHCSRKNADHLSVENPFDCMAHSANGEMHREICRAKRTRVPFCLVNGSIVRTSTARIKSCT